MDEALKELFPIPLVGESIQIKHQIDLPRAITVSDFLDEKNEKVVASQSEQH